MNGRGGDSFSPKQQKEFVKRGIDVPLREGTIWYPVAMDWWYSWRQYVNYDDSETQEPVETKENEEQNVDSLNPGPISNSAISLAEGSQELKPGLVEGQHYVLLPEPVFKRLKTIYGVQGNEFERNVIKQGGQTTMLQVELYPLKFIVFGCRPDGSREDEPLRTFLISRVETVASTKKILQGALSPSDGLPRIWLKAESEQQPQAETAMELEDPTTPSQSNVSTTPPTTEEGGKAEEDSWELIFSNPNSPSVADKLLTIFPFATSLTVMLETKLSTGFPRDVILNRWRNELKVGDLVDAIDTDKRWYAAVVLEVDEPKREIKVHFKGWSSKWDVKVSMDSDNIAKLFTHTTHWREELEIGTIVELKSTSDPVNPRWYQAKVKAIDGDKITVTCDNTPQDAIVDRNSEDICELYTHIKRDQAKKPANSSSTYTSSVSSYSYYSRGNSKGTPPIEGAVGLSNLGNTCFMNSMLQCISNTRGLTDFFINDEYKPQLNGNNPLGMNGKLAESYAKLMKEMWSGKYTIVAPSDFKRTIGEYAPQFAGFQQQDSQELMSFLLDGLHEDLNRIAVKPYVETVESKGRADELVARESWRRFMLRNDSAIVDQCYGLLKSYVRCAGCGFESITFDPYLSLSLPIPVQNQRELIIQVHPLPIGSQPVSVRVEVPITSNIMDVKAEVIRLFKDDVLIARPPTPVAEDGATEEGQSDRSEASRTPDVLSIGHSDGIYLHFCTAFSSAKHRVYKTGEDRQPVQEVVRSGDEVHIFQLEDAAPPKLPSPYPSHSHSQRREPAVPHSPFKFVDILIGKPGKKMYMSSSSIDLIGPPFRISFHEDATCDEVCAKVWEYFKRFVTEDAQEKYSLTSPPYELQVTTTMGTSAKGLFERGADKATARITNFDAITVVISADAEDDIDKDEFERVQNHASKTRAATGPRGGINLDQCFDKFVEREQLGAQEQWYCPSCKNHLAPIKKFDIWAAPDVLIIHLKRFQYIPGTYFVHREKISDLIDFPIDELDLRDYVIGPQPADAPPIYELYAVSEHSGGLGGGHYTASAKNPRNHRWYKFNDSSVHETDTQHLVTPQAYVLFYRRKHGAARWAGLTPLEQNLDEQPVEQQVEQP